MAEVQPRPRKAKENMIRLSPFKSVEPFRVSVVRSLFSGAEETTAVLKRIL